MDSRFNVKDIVMITLMVLLGIMIYLGMVQKDRQWDKVQEALALLKQQNDTLEQIRRGGVRVGTAQDQRPQGDVANAPAFERVANLPSLPDYAEGDFFIDAFSATVKTLTPLISGDIYADRIQEYVQDALLRLDPETLAYKPYIATDWTVSEDGLTFTFNMRKDVVFSDGKPLTAQDVQFTFDWIMNPKVAAPRDRSNLEKVESVKALDDYTVQFKFREPYFSALGLCGSMRILAKHYYSQFTEDQFNEMPGLLFGSGPYKMRTDPQLWQPGSQKIEVERNDNYWGPRPALDRIIWREILEDTAMEAEFRNRKLDRLSVRASSYREFSRDDKLREQANLHEYEYASSGYFYIGWNQKKNGLDTPFADKRVRQAMTLLIDRPSICSRVYDNLATPATGPFHPLSWQCDTSIKAWPFDPERAKKLLDEAGFIDRDRNGVRESPQGVPLSFSLVYSAGSSEVKQAVLLIQDAMKKAGVDMNLDALDWPIMQQKIDDRSFDAIMLGWGGVVDTDVYQMFHSSQMADGGDNYVSYVNPELDKLIEKARTTVDREKDTRLWQQVHAVLNEDQPYTFMMNRKAVVFVDKRLKNIQITPVGMNFAWEYYVPAALQMHVDR